MSEASQTPARTPADSSTPQRVRGKLPVVFGTLTGTLLGLVGVFCCLGLMLFRPEVDASPERAKELTNAMLLVDVPDEFHPAGTIEWNFFWFVLLRGAYYELPADEGQLMLLEVESGLLDEPEIREHVDSTLREKGGGGPPLTITDSEERVYNLRGRPVTFTFRVGESPDDHTRYHLVEGVVDGNSGPVLMAFRITDESWDANQALVERTILSVR